jgi:streptomycin 6-kinase
MSTTHPPPLAEFDFTEPTTRRTLALACLHTGIDGSDAKLLRHQTNAVYLLRRSGIVAKIAHPGGELVTATRTVNLVRWLAGQGFPTVGLRRDLPQPLFVAGSAVTFWDYLPQSQPVSAADIAEPLLRLHRSTSPPTPLPPLTMVAAIRSSLNASRILSERQRAYLSERCDKLAARLRAVRYLFPPGLVHGDPQHRNALHTDTSSVLCDWDSARHGQLEWDLATMEIHCRRFGYPAREYDDFAAAYGVDIRDWPHFPTVRDLRELRMITTNARKCLPGSRGAAEVIRRVDRWGTGEPHQWTIL